MGNASRRCFSKQRSLLQPQDCRPFAQVMQKCVFNREESAAWKRIFRNKMSLHLSAHVTTSPWLVAKKSMNVNTPYGWRTTIRMNIEQCTRFTKSNIAVANSSIPFYLIFVSYFSGEKFNSDTHEHRTRWLHAPYWCMANCKTVAFATRDCQLDTVSNWKLIEN